MSHVIDLNEDDPITLQQAAKVLKKSHPTVYRYATSGVHGVKLETVRLGKGRLTCMSAIQRFLDRLSELA